MANIDHLKRDPQKIQEDFKELASGKVITQKGCVIYFPQNYEDRRLVTIGAETYILGYHAIVIGDQYYGVSMVPAKMRSEPDGVDHVKIDERDYTQLTYESGSVVIADTNLVQNAQLLFDIYNEFIAKGNVPWYMTYRDLGELFVLSKQYAGTALGANQGIMELIAATIARDPNNLKVQFRHRLQTKADQNTLEPTIVKLANVTYGTTNTTTRLVGSYFEDGLSSALTNRSNQKEPIEDLLRE